MSGTIAPREILLRAELPLFGRGDDIAALTGLLERRRARLVTLSGAPGVGKTRLALEVIVHRAASFATGLFCVERPGMVAVRAVRLRRRRDQPRTARTILGPRDRHGHEGVGFAVTSRLDIAEHPFAREVSIPSVGKASDDGTVHQSGACHAERSDDRRSA